MIEKRRNKVFVKGHCLADDADQARQELVDIEGQIADNHKIEVDLSELEEIDSAGIQLLIAFVKTLKKRKVAVSLSRVNPQLSSLLKLSGLTKFFKIA